MTRCLRSALTFHHADLSQDLQGVACGGSEDSAGDTLHTPCIGGPLVGATRGRYRFELKCNEAHPLAKSRGG